MTEKPAKRQQARNDYTSILGEVASIVKAARHSAAKTVNAVMTAAYWLIGRQIVEYEQRGEKRADYGEALVEQLSGDLTGRFGCGFGKSNLFDMRAFYLACPDTFQTPSGKSGRHLLLRILLKLPLGDSTVAMDAGEDERDIRNRSHPFP